MGIVLVLVGVFALYGTFFKPSFYWENRKARRLRNLIGDKATSVVYYIIGMVAVVIGLLGMLNIIPFN